MAEWSDCVLNENKKRIIIGISGASGAPLAVEVLRALQRLPDWETHLTITLGAEKTIAQETSLSIEYVRDLADVYHDIHNIGACIASGTFQTEGMIVVPCSMKTVSGIATGYSENLLLRAADVVLKERRKLVLVARETPLNSIHLRNLLSLSDMGVTIMPPMLTYYNSPTSVENLTRHIAGKILDQFKIPYEGMYRWNPEGEQV